HQASGHLARQRAPRHLARQCGLRVNRHWTVSTGGIRLPDCLARQAGIGSPGMTAGTGSPGIRSILAGQRAPRHLARLVGTGSPDMTAGSESIATTVGTGDQVPDHLDQQRDRVNWPNRIVGSGSVHHAE
ncbi:unnamed protein product, partial [Staurois parvus]